MKSILCGAICISFFSNIQAQSFTNAGFETWEGPSGTYQIEYPTGWQGSDKMTTDNAFALGLAGITPVKQVYKSSDVHEGSTSVELRSKFLGDTVGVLPGVLFNAKADINLAALLENPDFSAMANFVIFQNATPILQKRVDSVTAWVKLTDENQDNASITLAAMQLAKGTSGNDTLIQIGGGLLSIEPGVSNEYRAVSVAMVYDDANNTKTDTLYVMIASSDLEDTATDGNTLFVDDVNLFTSDATTSIKQPLLSGSKMTVYPNPSQERVYFNLNPAESALDFKLTIFDISGRVLLNETLQQHINARELSGWSKGNYYYQLSNLKNNTRENGKFTIN